MQTGVRRARRPPRRADRYRRAWPWRPRAGPAPRPATPRTPWPAARRAPTARGTAPGSGRPSRRLTTAASLSLACSYDRASEEGTASATVPTLSVGAHGELIRREPDRQRLTRVHLGRAADHAVVRDAARSRSRGAAWTRARGRAAGPGCARRSSPAAGQAAGQRHPGPLQQGVDPFGLPLHLPDRVGQRGPGPGSPASQAVSRSSQPVTHRRARSRSWATRANCSPTSGTSRLAASVGVDARTIGHVVEQGRVLLVPDRAHHRRPARRDRPDQRLVGEREQVLQRAAAPGDHDHVHVGVLVEAPQRVDDLRGRVRSLHRRLLDPEPHGRPAPPGVLLSTSRSSRGIGARRSGR